MHSLVYISQSRQNFTEAQLLEMLLTFREKNARLGITGLLLYKDGNFMQALEGEKVAVEALYDEIRRDPRHTGVITILEGPVDERHFSDWSMGFRNLKAVREDEVPGYSPFFEVPLTEHEFGGQPSRAMGLLHLFRD